MMRYFLAYGILRLMAGLPLAAWYRLSDATAWIHEHLVQYRREVITTNLARAFPQRSRREVKALRRAFYRNFTDIIVEAVKSLGLSAQNFQKQYHLENPEVFRQLYDQKRGVIMVMGHQNNFEWTAMGIPLLVPQPCFAVYHPLKSPVMNRLVVRIRERFGLKLFPMKDTYPFMLNNPEPAPLYVFMADQSPRRDKIRYWAQFLGRSTPVHLGVENLARECDLAVAFLEVHRENRGHYRAKVKLLREHTRDLPKHQVTDDHVGALEKMIYRDPANWLWSHKRWKHAG